MKLTISRGGGIAGIVARTELETAKLPAPEAGIMEAEVKSAGILTLTEPAGGEPQPDSTLYEISLQSGDGSRVLHFTEESLPEPVRVLIAWVDSRPERVETLEF